MTRPSASAPTPLRIAIVGCGAVSRRSLLPVLAGHERIRIVALVDRDPARAGELAELYGVTRVHRDISEIRRDDVDAIVLATPPAHHAPAALDAIGRGLHVFVEKPMATRAADADAMVEAADRHGVALAVGLYRRLLPAARLMRGVLESELYGRPLSVDIEEGGEYSWQLTTMSVLTRGAGGGGVLIDLGTHLLDQLHFILPGAMRRLDYADNARGGIETDCELRLEIDSRWGAVPVRLELSRTRELRGTIVVTCERASIELMRADFCRLRVRPGPPRTGVGAGPDRSGAGESLLPDAVSGTERPFELWAHWTGESSMIGYKGFREEFDDWLRAIETHRDAELSGRSVVPVVRLIDECYAAAQPLPEPWTDEGLDAGAVASTSLGRGAVATAGRRPRVLVTGAGGFLGCRTVELLLQSGRWDVRALVRRPASAARLARLPLDIALGDVCNHDDMRRVLEGCDAVVHCAVGTGWPPEAAFKVTVEGTRTVAEAALAARVERFVHISSMAVHGERVPAQLDERVPLQPGTGVGYSRAKFLAEEHVSRLASRGLPAILLRPARIYGPFSKTFVVRPLTALRSGALVLAGDADSPSNMVYVDNVVEAILRALAAPASEIGEAFLVGEPDQLSWRAFYHYFADHAGAAIRIAPYPGQRTPAPGWWRRAVRGGGEIVLSPELRAMAKRIMWTDPFGTIPRRIWERSPGLQRRVLQRLGVDNAEIYREAPPPPAAETVFQIDPTLVVSAKAASRLGYRGMVPRARAMELTLVWARYARLV